MYNIRKTYDGAQTTTLPVLDRLKMSRELASIKTDISAIAAGPMAALTRLRLVARANGIRARLGGAIAAASGSSDVVAAIAARRVSVASLPDDMQVLLNDIAEEGGVKLPSDLPVRDIPLNEFPDAELPDDGIDARGDAHAYEMIGANVPPVVVNGRAWLDGRHRVAAAKIEGKAVIVAIDLAGIVPEPKRGISPYIGRLGEAYSTSNQDADDDRLSDDPNSPDYRYKDTGYIAGSRKEQVTEYFRQQVRLGAMIRAQTIDWEAVEQNPREAKELIVKGNLFGKTDWGDLRTAGMEPGAAFLLDRLYSYIPQEPATDSPEARKDYAIGLESIRDRMQTCKTAEQVLAVLDEIKEEFDGIQLNEEQAAEVARLRALHNEKRQLAIAARAEQEALAKPARLARSALNSAEYEQQARVRRKWKPDPELEAKIVELRRQAEAAERTYEQWREKNPEKWKSEKRDLGGGWHTYDTDVEFEATKLRRQIERVQHEAKMRNIVENQATRSWLAFGKGFFASLYWRGGKVAFSKHVANVKRGGVKDWGWADKDRVGVPKSPNREQVKFALRVADNFHRVGGQKIDVKSTAALKEAFGFRDIQSGNWVLKDPGSARFHVEQTAGAMADMGDILGIDAKALGLGGRLGMAFGARGTGNAGFGGAARAHYEPIQRVINLTKMGGGGALGHEFFHSVDNMLHELMGHSVGGSKGDYFTETPDLLPAGPIRDAARELQEAMLTGSVRQYEIHRFKPGFVAEAKAAVEGDVSRPTSRSGESKGKMIKDAGSGEAAVFAIEAYFKPYRKDNWYKKWRGYAAAYYAEDDSTNIALQTGAPASSFKVEATLMDGSSKSYWATNREMAARAFQSYLEDKLAALKRKNDYLSVFANNESYPPDPIFGVKHNPHPEGEERTRINAAFDKLFAALRAEQVFEKASQNTDLLDSIFGDSEAPWARRSR